MSKGAWERHRGDPEHPGRAERPVGRGKKDRRRWCKGRVGIEHQPQISESTTYARVCHPRPDWWERTPVALRIARRGGELAEWWCFHRLECAWCGKVLAHDIAPADCPTRTEVGAPQNLPQT